jgi:hypothetical protein
MGCVKKLGCLMVLLLAVAAGAAGAWYFLRARPSAADSQQASGVGGSTWQPLTPRGAQRAKTGLERLQSPRGPSSVTVVPGDLAAYIVQELSRTLPSSADSIEAAAIDDRLCVRAVVRVSDLGDKGQLGPLAMLLGDRERLHLCGTLRIIRPGSAELQVKELRIRDFNVPQPLIPRLVSQISRGTRPPGLSADGLPLATPEYIGDVRVQNGQITLYKATR